MLKKYLHDAEKDYEPYIIIDDDQGNFDNPNEEGEEINRFCDFCDCLLRHDKHKQVFCPMCGKQYPSSEKLKHGSKIVTIADSSEAEAFEQPTFADEDQAKKRQRKFRDREIEEWCKANHAYIERSTIVK